MFAEKGVVWRDRTIRALWIFKDLAFALGGGVAVGTYLSIDTHSLGLLIVLASALASLAYLVGTTIAMVAWLTRARWGRAAASAAKFLVFVALFLSCIRAGDYVHLALFYPAYRYQIEAQEAGNTAPTRFDWGDKAMWVTDGYQGETLVYDPTDSLAASIDEVRDSEAGFGLATRHLVGHFYIEYEFSR